MLRFIAPVRFRCLKNNSNVSGVLEQSILHYGVRVAGLEERVKRLAVPWDMGDRKAVDVIGLPRPILELLVHVLFATKPRIPSLVPISFRIKYELLVGSIPRCRVAACLVIACTISRER